MSATPRATLRAADARLAGVRRLSLAPGRARARSFAELGERLLPRLAPAQAEALADGLARLGDAMRAAFPENLFWDLDALAAARAAEPPGPMTEAFDALVRLHCLFGRETTIRFRYVHDFLYGYDWAKWVARDPSARADVAPYDLAFCRAMLARGEELIALIANDDAKYHALEGDAPRNPFGFSREPEDERALHRALAARGEIPVDAWRLAPAPRWRPDPYAARERCARRLSLGAPLG